MTAGGGAVLLDRSMVARWLELVESVPAGSASDVRLREELRRALGMSVKVAAARRVAEVLATSDTRGRPQTSGTAEAVQVARPFGDERTTEQAAAQLRISPRQVGRRCHFDADHPDALRYRRRGRGLVVSGFDVDARLRR